MQTTSQFISCMVCFNFYLNLTEDIPPDAPPPHGRHVQINAFVMLHDHPALSSFDKAIY